MILLSACLFSTAVMMCIPASACRSLEATSSVHWAMPCSHSEVSGTGVGVCGARGQSDAMEGMCMSTIDTHLPAHGNGASSEEYGEIPLRDWCGRLL